MQWTVLRRVHRWVLLAAGSALFVYLLIRLDPREILSLMSRVGAGYLLIAAAYLVHQLFRALAYQRCFVPGVEFPYRDVARVRLSGEAVRYLTLTGPLLAEPAKAWLLRKHGVEMRQAIAATVLEYLIYCFTSAGIAIVGLAYILYAFQLSGPVAMAARVAISASGAFLLAGAFAILRRFYLIGAIVKGAGKLPGVGKYLRVDPDELRATEDLLFAILRDRPGRFASIIAIELAGQGFLMLELLAFLTSIGLPFSRLDPFLIEAATKFIGPAFFFIPGQLGASEGTYALVLQTVGLTASAGFSLALARRLRNLLIAGLGLALLPPDHPAWKR